MRQWIIGGAPPLPVKDPTNPIAPVVPTSELARQAKMIFIKHCYKCHKFDEAKGGIKIMHHRLLVHVRKVVIPGDPGNSELYQLLLSDDPEKQMPPNDVKQRLTADELATIKRWIAAGAVS